MSSQSSLNFATVKGSLRPCWECHRRRRHCDFSHPECKKCLAANISCPGYEKKKPVTWLAPGTVLSRPRKAQMSTAGQVVDGIESTWNKDISRSTIKDTSYLTIPVYSWRDETTSIVDAICYYNSEIYSSLYPTLELGPNPYATKLPLEYLPYFSIAYQHCLAYLVLSHRIYQLQSGAGSDTLNQMWLRISHHRALAIRSIRESIEKCSPNINNSTTYDILTLMCAEVQLSPMESTWRLHLESFMKVVTLRGGFRNVFHSAVAYKFGLLGFLIIGVMANTTAPASDQTAAATYFSSLDFIQEIYRDVIYPTFLCPYELLECVIQINYLRHQVTQAAWSIGESQPMALALVERLGRFSPSEWVKPDAPHQRLWLLAGHVYHSAVLLFCISSLQSLLLLPRAPHLESLKAMHNERLFELLSQTMDSPQLMPSMSWPLVVSGIHVEKFNVTRRSYITAKLMKMSRDMGVALPLAAKAVLEKHWASGNLAWDDCFDRPYVFVW